MSAAAPEGAPQRWVNNREYFENMELPRRAPREALRRGALISAIFKVPV
jgi:hypothetical protein